MRSRFIVSRRRLSEFLNIFFECSIAVICPFKIAFPQQTASPLRLPLVKQAAPPGRLHKQALQFRLVAVCQRLLQPLQAGGKLVDLGDEVFAVGKKQLAPQLLVDLRDAR